MKKGKFLTLANIISLVSIVLGIVAICMMFTNSVGLALKIGEKTSESTAYSGLNATFGKENVFAFSFMNLLTYILVIAAIVFAILKLTNVFSGKLSSILTTILFVVAGVFFFCSGTFSVVVEEFNTANSLLGSITGNNLVVVKTLEIGSIIAGICSLLAGVCSLVPLFTAKKQTKSK